MTSSSEIDMFVFPVHVEMGSETSRGTGGSRRAHRRSVLVHETSMCRLGIGHAGLALRRHRMHAPAAWPRAFERGAGRGRAGGGRQAGRRASAERFHRRA